LWIVILSFSQIVIVYSTVVLNPCLLSPAYISDAFPVGSIVYFSGTITSSPWSAVLATPSYNTLTIFPVGPFTLNISTRINSDFQLSVYDEMVASSTLELTIERVSGTKAKVCTTGIYCITIVIENQAAITVFNVSNIDSLCISKAGTF